jgi:hypothetical protein
VENRSYTNTIAQNSTMRFVDVGLTHDKFSVVNGLGTDSHFVYARATVASYVQLPGDAAHNPSHLVYYDAISPAASIIR